MRIAFVIDSLDGLGGGVATARRFVAALRQRHDVTLVTTGPAGAGRVTVPGFELPLHAMRAQQFAFGWPVRATLERVLAAVDVVHLQFPFLLSFAALRIARRRGLPVVASFNVQPENLLHGLGIRAPWLNRFAYRLWTRAFYERADLVLCPTAFAEELLREHGLRKPVAIVSNGAPPGWGRATPRQPPAPDAPVHVLSVGRFAREKRHDVILEAVARSRHRARLRLAFAGAGPLDREIRAHAARLGLPLDIEYASPERLRALYEEATVFVHASEVELEGMAVVEALVMGLPLLLADAPANASARYAPGPDFLFRSGDPAALAARLDALLDDPEAYAAASAFCVKLAPQFDFATCVRQLERAYTRVVEQAAAAEAAPVKGDRPDVPPRLAAE